MTLQTCMHCRHAMYTRLHSLLQLMAWRQVMLQIPETLPTCHPAFPNNRKSEGLLPGLPRRSACATPDQALGHCLQRGAHL